VRTSEIDVSDQGLEITYNFIQSDCSVDVIGRPVASEIWHDTAERGTQSLHQRVPFVVTGAGGTVDQQNRDALAYHPVVQSRPSSPNESGGG
jgi:hypothetical protein